MRILYAGLPLGALCLSAAGHRPVVAALGPLDLPGRRRVRARLGASGALVLGMPDLADPAVRRALEAARPDALLSWFWPRRIPREVLDLAPLGAFGTHPSLLPRWRGPDPYFWAIRSGDAETGVTLHRLTPEYDAGAVVAARRVPIDPADDAWTLARKLDRPALELLVECARRLSGGDRLEGTPQDPEQVTWAPSPGAEDLAIDWRAPAADVVRLVRAASPEPGAAARIGESEVEVLGARVFPRPVLRALAPAEAMRTDDGLVVRCGDAGVWLERVRVDGDVLRGPETNALVSARRS